MRTAILAASLVLYGCGTTEPADELVGVWTADLTASCALAVKFDGNGRFEYYKVCPSGSGVSLQQTLGAFSVHSGVLDLTADASSCADWSPATVHIGISVTPEQMTWRLTTGLSFFVKQHPSSSGSSGGVVSTFGCFKAGVFTPSPVVAL